MYKVLIARQKGCKFNLSKAQKETEKILDFHGVKIPIQWDEVDVDIEIKFTPFGISKKTKRMAFGLRDAKSQLSTQVDTSRYHAIIFTYDYTKNKNAKVLQKHGYIASFTHWEPLGEAEFVALALDSKHVRAGYTEATLPHELMHTFCKRATRKGRPVQDMMDVAIVSGRQIPYYKNQNPYALDGNFALTFEQIQPHLGAILEMKEESKGWPITYFSPDEPTNEAGTHTVSELDMDFLIKLDKARDVAGVSFRLNSGYRTPAENKREGGAKNSAHLRRKAADIHCIDNEKRFKIVNALLEVGFSRIGIAKTFIHADDDSSLPSPRIWLYS